MLHRRRFPLSLLLIWLSVLVFGLSGSSLSRAEDDPETTTARQRFQEGVRYFDSGQYAKARVSFLQAYALKQHPAVLLNLAQSELRTPGHEAIAAQHFAEYLKDSTESGKRSEAEQGLSAAKEKIITVTVTVDRPGSKILVNGEEYGVAPLDEPIFLKPASYTIEARIGDDTRSKELDAAAGDETEVAFEFETRTEPAPIPAAEPETTEPSPKARRTREPRAESTGREKFFPWLTHRPIGLVLGILAPVAVGAGVGLQVAAKRQYNEADQIEAQILAMAVAENLTEYTTGQKPCGDYKTLPAVQNPLIPGDTRYHNACTAWVDTTGRGDDLRAGSWIAFGGAAAATAGLVTYYLIDSRTSGESASAPTLQVTPVLAGTLSGLVVTGRF